MSRLATIKHEKLTDNIIKSLKNNNIYNTIDFVQQDSEKICAITKLSFKDVLEIRRYIFDTYSKCINAFDYHKLILSSFAILPTCILSLDNLLNGGLRCCKITEICGLPDSGKTLLGLSILANISSIFKQKSLIVDSKNDFDGMKFHRIITQKCQNETEVNECLSGVSVVKVSTLRECLSLLHEVYSQEERMRHMAVLLIDSLPALVLQHKDENNNREYFGLLNNLVNIIRRLSNKYNIPVIVTNLLTRWVNSVPADSSYGAAPKYKTEIKPTLGKYWSHIPFISLDVTKTSSEEVVVSIRNSNIPCNLDDKITMRITDEGIV